MELHLPARRQVLTVLSVGGVLAVLALLGFAVAAMLSPLFSSDAPREIRPPPPPAPAPVAAAPSPPPPPPAPPPTPAPPPPVAVVAAPPTPAPVVPPALANSKLSPLTRLGLRREVIAGLTALKGELGQCSSSATRQETLAGQSFVVLETEARDGSVKVTSTSLDQGGGAVNDAFVTCARNKLNGREFAAKDAKPGMNIRISIPLGPRGDSLSLPATFVGEEDPRQHRVFPTARGLQER